MAKHMQVASNDCAAEVLTQIVITSSRQNTRSADPNGGPKRPLH